MIAKKYFDRAISRATYVHNGSDVNRFTYNLVLSM